MLPPAGRAIESENLVSWPNWRCLNFRVEDEGRFDTRRLNRLLEMEGAMVNRHKACRQADVLMLFCRFSPEKSQEMFSRRGAARVTSPGSPDGQVRTRQHTRGQLAPGAPWRSA